MKAVIVIDIQVINLFPCIRHKKKINISSRRRLNYFLVSGPDRGLSPVEWREFPSVRPSVHSPLEGPKGSEAYLAGSEACLAGSEA